MAIDFAAIKLGLELTKTAGELLKGIKDRYASGKIDKNELEAKLGDILECINGSRQALFDASEHVHTLNHEIRDLTEQLKKRASMKYAGGAYWKVDDGPFCQVCWDSEEKQIRMVVGRPRTDGTHSFQCHIHNFHSAVKDCTIYAPSPEPKLMLENLKKEGKLVFDK